MFLHHEACPSCGSRDNLGRYADGGAFCFGCHYTERATHYVPKSGIIKEYEKPPVTDNEFPPVCVEWIQQYGITVEELLRRNCGWNSERQQLVFRFEGSDCWQARNFRESARTKYFTQGNVNDLIPVYGSGHNEGRLVVVEDCISAIKCARQCDAMPVLGSHVSLAKLHGISKLYKEIIVWLDSDKYRESRQLSEQARLIGLSSRSTFSKRDPKEYSDEIIRDVIQGQGLVQEAEEPPPVV